MTLFEDARTAAALTPALAAPACIGKPAGDRMGVPGDDLVCGWIDHIPKAFTARWRYDQPHHRFQAAGPNPGLHGLLDAQDFTTSHRSPANIALRGGRR